MKRDETRCCMDNAWRERLSLQLCETKRRNWAWRKSLRESSIQYPELGEKIWGKRKQKKIQLDCITLISDCDGWKPVLCWLGIVRLVAVAEEWRIVTTSSYPHSHLSHSDHLCQFFSGLIILEDVTRLLSVCISVPSVLIWSCHLSTLLLILILLLRVVC